MLALIKEGPTVVVGELPVPRPGTGEVLVRVMAAGICRTDLAVARGEVACRDPVVLGHELAGVVAETGAGVSGVAPGLAVTVMPALPDGMLGVDRHGAFAEYVTVPATAVLPLPSGMPWIHGAFVEPIAAALAVLDAGVAAGQRVLVYGDNRIARLTQRVLATRGVPAELRPGGKLPDAAYDVVVETVPTAQAFSEMIGALRRRGTLVIKSRRHAAVGISLAATVEKELSLRAVRYGDFAAAVALAAGEAAPGAPRLELGDLVGPTFALRDFAAAFEVAAAEAQKPFFLSG